MQIIVWSHTNGNMGRLIPATNQYVQIDENGNRVGDLLYTLDKEIDGYRRLTLQELIEKDIDPSTVVPNTSPIIVDADSFPDTYFRNAFFISNGSVLIDMNKAINVQKNNLRALRIPELEALDIQYYRALETNDSQTISLIIARKNALRNVTKDPGFEAATTPDELKLVGINTINGV